MATATETETIDDVRRQRDFAIGWMVEQEISRRAGEDPLIVEAEARARFLMAAAKASDTSYYVRVARDQL